MNLIYFVVDIIYSLEILKYNYLTRQINTRLLKHVFNGCMSTFIISNKLAFLTNNTRCFPRVIRSSMRFLKLEFI